LDAHYRTLPGFAVLVEREWCSFGHKFADRVGCARRADHRPTERAPVWLQWLECVSFLVRQFPGAFEFGDELLVFLADAGCSARFGTLLADSERQRHWELRSSKRTASVWTYALAPQQRIRFANPNYQAVNAPLWPHVALRRCCVWDRYYGRWDAAMHPEPAWTCDYGDLGGLWPETKKAAPGDAATRMRAEGGAADALAGAAIRSHADATNDAAPSPLRPTSTDLPTSTGLRKSPAQLRTFANRRSETVEPPAGSQTAFEL